jgi:Flp pilus assembly protein TadD
MRSLRVLASLSLALISASPGFAAAQQEAHPAGHARTPALGTIVFPNSGNAAAQEPFLRGIAFLHSFEYDESAIAFREARRADGSFALSYWGEALSYSHMLWGMEDLPAARAVLAKLGAGVEERLAKARTPRERMFGAAVEAYFADVPRAQRIRAYADSLHRLALADPNDQEASAFAAHALLLTTFVTDNDAQRDSVTREAIGFAQHVVDANPKHPGATHYLIHLYDSPAMAAQGLAAARAYDTIAPDAEHALHMPSHIYLQLGLWNDVVNSNERAWAASRASTENASELDWHAFSWLQYAYLQQGRFAAARGLIDTARALLIDTRGKYVDASVVLTRLEFQYAAETGRWTDQPITAPSFRSEQPGSDRERAFRGFSRYWLTVDAAQRRDTVALLSLATPWVALADSLRSGAVRPAYSANSAFQVEALVARARGDRARYLESLRLATEKEQRMLPFSGPPERLLSLELLGTELLADGRNAEAARAFEDVLRKCPNRSQALLGLARAKAAAGDRAGADDALAKVRANWTRADAAVIAGLKN